MGLPSLEESRSSGMKSFPPMSGKNLRKRKDRKDLQNFIWDQGKEKQFWVEKIRKMRTREKETLMMKIRVMETTNQSRRKRMKEFTGSLMLKSEDSSRATRSSQCH